MSERPIQFETEREPEIPAGLQRGLREVYGGSAQVEPRVDEAVMGMVRRRAAAGRVRRRLGIGAWGLAGAAGLAIAGVVTLRGLVAHRTDQSPSGLIGGTGVGGAMAKAEDVNGDGVVDIRDALAIGLVVDRKPSPTVRERRVRDWDLNGDGAVDQRDVDRVATAAVGLGKGG
jgi:hypothetical protein